MMMIGLYELQSVLFCKRDTMMGGYFKLDRYKLKIIRSTTLF